MRSSYNRFALVLIVTTGLLASTVALAHVNQQKEIIRLGYALSSANDELRTLEEEQRRLRVERSMLTHPSRLLRLASELGLQAPEPGQVRVIRPGTPAFARAEAPVRSPGIARMGATVP